MKTGKLFKTCPFFIFGAEGGTRTRTELPATPSRWCVYQVPPLRQKNFYYLTGGIGATGAVGKAGTTGAGETGPPAGAWAGADLCCVAVEGVLTTEEEIDPGP